MLCAFLLCLCHEEQSEKNVKVISSFTRFIFFQCLGRLRSIVSVCTQTLHKQCAYNNGGLLITITFFAELKKSFQSWLTIYFFLSQNTFFDYMEEALENQNGR